jgi:hypothetical protein
MTNSRFQKVFTTFNETRLFAQPDFARCTRGGDREYCSNRYDSVSISKMADEQWAWEMRLRWDRPSLLQSSMSAHIAAQTALATRPQRVGELQELPHVVT